MVDLSGRWSRFQYIQKQTKKRKLNIHHDEGLACLLVQGPKAHGMLLSIMSQSQTQVPARFQHVIFNFEGHNFDITKQLFWDDGFEIFVKDAGAQKFGLN